MVIEQSQQSVRIGSTRGNVSLNLVQTQPEPILRITEVYAFPTHSTHACKFPLYGTSVQAGFPSPADDYIERYLDLNAEFIKHPSATFLLKAVGDSMVDIGIFSGDTLVVDRSIAPSDRNIVIAAVNGELTVKRLSCKNGLVQLLPENSNYPPIDITADHDLVIWGVVILVLHKPT